MWVLVEQCAFPVYERFCRAQGMHARRARAPRARARASKMCVGWAVLIGTESRVRLGELGSGSDIEKVPEGRLILSAAIAEAVLK